MSANNYWCPRCDRDIPTLHSWWEGVNSIEKVHWSVNFCRRCGTVTGVEKEAFYYGNLLPRIGRVKSFLFVMFGIGTPFHAIAWAFALDYRFLPLGIIISSSVLAFAVLAARAKVHEVVACPYEREQQYPELVRY